MSIATLPAVDCFRSDAVRGLPEQSRVDRKAGIIRGAKAIQFGRLNPGDSRDHKVDAVTLSQIRDLVNQRNQGAKSRFSHPSMSSDGMGKHLGRVNNAKIVGEETEDAYVSVDLKLSDASSRSPKGNLRDHVLDLAEESPEDFGMSVAGLLDRKAMNDAYDDEKKRGVDDGRLPIRFSGLRAIDVVDEPAATRGGLFSLDSDSLADLPAQATDLLDTFFSESSPDVIRARFDDFLNTYLSQRGDDPMSKDNDNEKQIEQLKADNEKLQKQITELSAKQDPPPTKPEQSTDTDKAKAELSRRSEISALCKLAKVCDIDRDLMIAANFSRSEAQDYLKASGKLSISNPPVAEGGADPAEKKQPTDDEKFGAEYDQFADIYERQGISREDFIASRKIDGNGKLLKPSKS